MERASDPKLALRPDPPAVRVHDALRDVETEPEAARRAVSTASWTSRTGSSTSRISSSFPAWNRATSRRSSISHEAAFVAARRSDTVTRDRSRRRWSCSGRALGPARSALCDAASELRVTLRSRSAVLAQRSEDEWLARFDFERRLMVHRHRCSRATLSQRDRFSLATSSMSVWAIVARAFVMSVPP